MIAVNLWIAQELQLCIEHTELLCQWQIVRISENGPPAGQHLTKYENWSTPFNTFSAPFASLLHGI